MKSKKGFTLIELLVLIAFLVFIIGGILGIVCIVKGVGIAGNAIDNHKVAYEQRLETNPPLYKVGDIVYHKASDKKMIVTKQNTTWDDVKKGWGIKVKDGGNMDVVGGFIINETEVKLSLKEVGR